VRRVEDITEALWGTRVSPSTVSDLNKKIYGTIEAWRNRPIEVEHPYVYLDGIALKRSWAGADRKELNHHLPLTLVRAARSENTCAATANFLAFRSYIKTHFSL
jgi:Transposase, Mutator family